ncbi:MAG TPA: hypothetical protein ENH62_16200 [Marinobacter sp.]|nr:hypothetical protein [Marinobacter sp.]
MLATKAYQDRLAEMLEVASAAIIERDRLKAINAELLTALEALCDLMPQTRPGNMQSDEYHIWLQADKARTVIAKAQPEPSK